MDIGRKLESARKAIGYTLEKASEKSGISAPTLIIHSKYDGGVDLSHPRFLTDHIPNNTLFISEAENHMFWYSYYYSEIRVEMKRFLDSLP